MRSNERVHATHCCILHGCKYGDSDCPVVSGIIEQEYLCEECAAYGIKSFEDMKKVITSEIKTCKNCGHIIN